MAPFTCSRGHGQGQAAQGWRAPWGCAVTLRGGLGFEPRPTPVDAGRALSRRLPAGPLRAWSSAKAARPAGMWSSGVCEGSGRQSPAQQVCSTRGQGPCTLSASLWGPCPRFCREPSDLESPSLTVGSALPDEVSVELVVDVDLHVIHPVNLQGVHRAGCGDWSPRHAPRSPHRQAGRHDRSLEASSCHCPAPSAAGPPKDPPSGRGPSPWAVLNSGPSPAPRGLDGCARSAGARGAAGDLLPGP